MANILVISTTVVPDHVRGALSRWLIEPTAGLYVGTVSAKVRDELWDAVADSVGGGEAVCIHPASNEQGFSIKTAGERHRRVADFDGLQLVRFLPLEEPETDDIDADF
ncbi:type I-E CRISPR-associated endoribonuclease Cas2 [Nocardia terpenica]|uniref:type I-E CRISPR-associated endoribonuclease Cas2e n=1 Tax=Nocardia terpenica TaxID=455432 RepID=UPI0018949053|nr:type I-E CRISPR-associated endoribonuclease Cas2e [Nocardia terpenica]MBF6063515.1 type I-E CRISPR-associated endoribonuclease Cas2 [Nocardia terpenica]MBF6106071.1 type I-E CRISPR-associated endoribonuclease Cas2 [Nocardia terpenica]MBF6113344.1 type I-E CRISPR-associated endoribonuclease Cas2 [Nocardia terpenica]MBF6119812.1 type I-E CRISPR-associated endoribonuclease Cas2 [Nocardia terpenica]MBF6152223.1 type I-E CRISPR-associated endoribonuclease Cas2 [Nocardia terpenica]